MLEDESFAYDDNGNRTSGGAVTGPYNRLNEDDSYCYLSDIVAATTA